MSVSLAAAVPVHVGCGGGGHDSSFVENATSTTHRHAASDSAPCCLSVADTSAVVADADDIAVVVGDGEGVDEGGGVGFESAAQFQCTVRCQKIGTAHHLYSHSSCWRSFPWSDCSRGPSPKASTSSTLGTPRERTCHHSRAPDPYPTTAILSRLQSKCQWLRGVLH